MQQLDVLKQEKMAEGQRMNEEFDTWYTENIVCPYCGYVNDDSWEIASDYDDAYECEECGKTFSWERIIDVSYTSHKVDK